MKQPEGKRYYPLMLDMKGKNCVIVGGGTVAQRKAEALLEAGAEVTLISPSFTAQLEQRALSGEMPPRLIRERYRPGMPELGEAFLVFAATDVTEINSAVRLEAESLGKLVTVANDAAGSGFIVPAVVRRGKLVIAVSTEGASPGTARKVKRELEQMFGDEYETYLELLQQLRVLVQSIVGDTAERQAIFRAILDLELLAWIRSGRFDEQAGRELALRIAADPTEAGIRQLDEWIRRLD
ncbi:precorrin-2 dehydrogenase/sirohydrochlorin ferrochelatase family protein [Paenibacillus piri]|uniref:precorrin-2 dehydrogenase/sirohydrochlorin ferrochelatase family protein n=1 Tax=Paenibacillus piri TaxID=2547395 RepID=UPI001404B3D8|nr:bifunctional precorrin-2 dehydrogenase/sirohydrochlorin ferrochelatase [Paenibacillus piri]